MRYHATSPIAAAHRWRWRAPPSPASHPSKFAPPHRQPPPEPDQAHRPIRSRGSGLDKKLIFIVGGYRVDAGLAQRGDDRHVDGEVGEREHGRPGNGATRPDVARRGVLRRTRALRVPDLLDHQAATAGSGSAESGRRSALRCAPRRGKFAEAIACHGVEVSNFCHLEIVTRPFYPVSSEIGKRGSLPCSRCFGW